MHGLQTSHRRSPGQSQKSSNLCGFLLISAWSPLENNKRGKISRRAPDTSHTILTRLVVLLYIPSILSFRYPGFQTWHLVPHISGVISELTLNTVANHVINDVRFIPIMGAAILNFFPARRRFLRLYDTEEHFLEDKRTSEVSKTILPNQSV